MPKYKVRVTDSNGQNDSEPLPHKTARLNYENRILVEVKKILQPDHGYSNVQIELLDELDKAVCEFIIEASN